MPIDQLVLRAHLERAGLHPRHLSRVISMCLGSPARKTGKGALDNVVVRFQSQKNGEYRLLESHTVERLYAYELELDPTVVCYYCQVGCQGVERLSKNGRKHVSNATVDFLVVRDAGIELVECKAPQAAAALVQRLPHEWRSTEEAGITRPSLERWGAGLGISYRVWVQPADFPIVLANRALLYGMSTVKEPPAAHRSAMALLARSAHTVSELCERVRDFTPLTALQLLRSRLCFGPIASVALDDIDNFLLFADKEQAKVADALGKDLARQRLGQADDPVSSATLLDLTKARERLARLRRMEAGAEPFTRAFKKLRALVISARDAGTSEVAACLTEYAKCGNRAPRLIPQQEEAISVVTRQWRNGSVQNHGDAYLLLHAECESREVPVPARSTLAKRLGKENSAKRALSTGGMRRYQKTRGATDPRSRSLGALAIGAHLQIDATPIDSRVFPGIEDALLLDRPLIYAGVDRCADGPVAHSLGFGPARTSALAMLLRDYVHRYGKLPLVIQVDRGPEMTANWLQEFCDYFGIILLINPTAGSVFNGQVENLHGRLNTVLHRLPGSTKPDRDGRGVDGKFKSYRTAKLQFSFLRREVATILHEDVWATPLADGRSPSERCHEALHLFGHVGKPQAFDEEFLFQTSMRAKVDALNDRKGIRLDGYTYSSAELLAAARSSELKEVRRDCADPTLVRVQLESGRYKAWSSLAPRLAARSDADMEFHSYYSATLRREARPRRDDIRRRQYSRSQQSVPRPDLSYVAETDAAEQRNKPQTVEHLSYDEIADYPEMQA